MFLCVNVVYPYQVTNQGASFNADNLVGVAGKLNAIRDRLFDGPGTTSASKIRFQQPNLIPSLCQLI
jgi:hypothetical protein